MLSTYDTEIQMCLDQLPPHAVYVHCCSHRLNLVLSSVAKVSGHVNKFFETLNSVHAT